MVSGLALSVKSYGFASSPKGRALGSPRKLHLFTKSFPFKERLSAQGGLRCNRKLCRYAKASPFEERLPPRRGKMSHSDKKGSVDLRSKDGEGEHAKNKSIRNESAVFLKCRKRWLQMLFLFCIKEAFHLPSKSST